jgi:hypothetical protein
MEQNVVCELVEFINHKNPEVVKLAVEQIASLTGSEEGQNSLFRAGVVSPLVKHVYRTNSPQVEYKMHQT